MNKKQIIFQVILSILLKTVVYANDLSPQDINILKIPSEYKIPPKKLSNGQYWEDVTTHQGKVGSCGSHTVRNCLSYIHGTNNIMIDFLHKSTLYQRGVTDYINMGNSTGDLMNLAYEIGVPPEGVKLQDSVGTYPLGNDGYSFDKVIPIFDARNKPNTSFVEILKESLYKYQVPIALCLHAPDVYATDKKDQSFCLFNANSYKIGTPAANKDNSLLKKYKDNIASNDHHAITVYGYSDTESGLLIKNSWGDNWKSNGNAILDYDYVNMCAKYAYVGIGKKIIQNNYYIRYGYTSRPTDHSLLIKGTLSGLGVIALGVLAAGALPAAAPTAVVYGYALGLGSAGAGVMEKFYWENISYPYWNPRSWLPSNMI